MESNAILTVSTAGSAGSDAVVGPAPVLELIFASHYLARNRRSREETLPWAERVRAEAPELYSDVLTLYDLARDGFGPGHALFPMAIDFGYAWDDDPRRFLNDLPTLEARLRKEIGKAPAGADDPLGPRDAWILDPPDPGWIDNAQSSLRALWTRLGPVWSRQGRGEAETAAHAVRGGLEAHGDVLRALPPHHFAQFESVAEKLRSAADRGRLWLVPLALAAGGGFHLETDGATAVGFGLRSEHAYARTERQVAEAAAFARAVADPTRLHLLTMVIRYPEGAMTLGDLARQLGVRQPTVSGHLKQLREAGLITTERKGNRTVPRVDRRALRVAVDLLDEVLDRPIADA